MILLFVFGSLALMGCAIGLGYFASWADDNSRSTAAFGFGIIGCIITSTCAVVMICITVSFGYNSVAAGARAKVLNTAFGTHYTSDDVFYGDDIIKQVIQGQKSNINVNLTKEEKE